VLDRPKEHGRAKSPDEENERCHRGPSRPWDVAGPPVPVHVRVPEPAPEGPDVSNCGRTKSQAGPAQLRTEHGGTDSGLSLATVRREHALTPN
jgi:hypothetical protein